MSITSETFYRAECDHDGCPEMLPTGDDGASHWPRVSVIEALSEERGAHDETWAVVGEKTYCPRHAPGNVDCAVCSDGFIRTEREAGSVPRFDYAQCPVCGGIGYLAPGTEVTR